MPGIMPRVLRSSVSGWSEHSGAWYRAWYQTNYAITYTSGDQDLQFDMQDMPKSIWKFDLEDARFDVINVYWGQGQIMIFDTQFTGYRPTSVLEQKRGLYLITFWRYIQKCDCVPWRHIEEKLIYLESGTQFLSRDILLDMVAWSLILSKHWPWGELFEVKVKGQLQCHIWWKIQTLQYEPNLKSLRHLVLKLWPKSVFFCFSVTLTLPFDLDLSKLNHFQILSRSIVCMNLVMFR